MFVLASAIVAFRGWPQVADQPSTVAVAVGQPGAGPGSRDARRLTVALAAPTGAPGTANAAGTPASGARVRTGVNSGAPGSRQLSTAGSDLRASTSRSPGCTGGGCGVPIAPGTVTNVTSTVAQTVSSAGASAGSAISGVAGTVAGQVSGVNPPAAGAVHSAGTSAGGAVSASATTAAGAVSSASAALGGGH